jgi:hypothetical protein
MNTSTVLKKLAMAAAGAALLNLGVGKAAHAVLLGSGTLEITTGTGSFENIPIPNEFEVTVSIPLFEAPSPPEGPGGFFPTPSDPTLFRGTIISPSTVGQTFTATQSTDADFNDFVLFLTNGRTNQININYREINGSGGGSGVGAGETFFTGNPSQIDFLGSSIDSISLLINSLTVTNTSSNDFTQYFFSATATLSINGQPSNGSSCGL